MTFIQPATIAPLEQVFDGQVLGSQPSAMQSKSQRVIVIAEVGKSVVVVFASVVTFAPEPARWPLLIEEPLVLPDDLRALSRL